MRPMLRGFFSVTSDDLTASRDWYVGLLGYEVEFDSDWFVHLRDPANPCLELGILSRSHEVVPERVRSVPTGGFVTLVVEDVDAVHRHAQERGVEVLEEPTDQFYGQRRMLVVDPNGLVLDISSECPPDPDWLASLST